MTRHPIHFPSIKCLHLTWFVSYKENFNDSMHFVCVWRGTQYDTAFRAHSESHVGFSFWPSGLLSPIGNTE